MLLSNKSTRIFGILQTEFLSYTQPQILKYEQVSTWNLGFFNICIKGDDHWQSVKPSRIIVGIL